MIAKVVRTKGGKVIDEIPFDNIVVEGAIRDRDELYGVHVHAFQPKPGRDYWLITWPLELEPERAAEELLYFALGMLPEGEIVMPAELAADKQAPYIWATFNQPVVYSTRLRADGRVEPEDVHGIGHRFVVTP